MLDLEEGYKKIVPPFTTFTEELNQDGKETIIPVPVNISISLLNIVEVHEVDFSITFQFEITLEWMEYRANYNNLKPRIYMNTLTKDDVEKLWLPMVIYKNTDQKESTRLGENWEWRTNVFITQEGGFTNSSDEVVDETRIFKGSENRLTMQQTYAHKFQCSYKLQNYPFDTQVPQQLALFIFPEYTLTWKHPPTKTDDFLEKFRRGGWGGSFPIQKFMLQIFAIIKGTSVMNFRKNPQHDFPKMRGGGGLKAIRNFSENSSVLVCQVFLSKVKFA